MHINVSDAFAVKAIAFNEAEHLIAVRDHGHRQILQQFQYRRAIGQAATSDLADHKRVYADQSTLQQLSEFDVTPAQMIHPYRRVHQDQDLAP